MGVAFRPRSWVPVLGVGLCGCIVSVAGLTGGGGDAGKADSSIDTGRPDVVVDEAAGPEGGSDGGNCKAPYSPPDAAVIACPAPSGDAGAEGGAACSPVSLPSFEAHFIPPNPPQSVCTAAQIAMVVTCLSTNSAACTSFVAADAGNQTCIQCMVSPTNAQSYGPVIIDPTNSVDSLNIGGCIALVDPCEAPCAYVAQATQQCHFAACASCPLSTSMDLQLFDECTSAADTCSCLPESSANQDCATHLETTTTANCYPAKGFATAAQFYGKVFCGGGP